jgi:glycosyltransferase involved in cell wall biosynthesis
MHIGIDIREAIGSPAGKGVYARELVRALLVRAGKVYRFTLFTREPIDFDVPEGVQVRVVRLPGLLWHVYVAWYARFVAGVDLFFAPTSYIIPALMPRRSVFVVHDVYVFTSPERHLKKASFVERVTLRRVLAGARVAVAVSEFTVEEVARLLPDVRVSFVVVPNAVAVDDVDGGVVVDVRDRFSLARPFLLFVGTIEPRKNLIRLIRAFADVLKSDLGDRGGWDGDLVIAGKKGWFYEEVFQAVEVAGISDRVHFLGFVSDNEKRALYEAADGLVFPSLYEGFGIPPLEAMSLRCPVVVSDIGALREVVGDAGVYIDPRDEGDMAAGMRKLLADADLRATLRDKGVIRAQQFSWDDSAMRLLSVFDSFRADRVNG